ncbi:2-amino-3-carboxymuconate-6-semialdehyde decarboxylase, partial [Aureobasidium melanogenum]
MSAPMNNDVEMQYKPQEQMQAAPSDAQLEQGNQTEQKPKRTFLGMRGGGLLVDMCACFICCECMDGCCHAIDDCLCCCSPGACILQGQASHELARKLNLESARIRDQEPEKFGFFANLPDILDTQAALVELQYALDVLKADGVTLFTRYGKGNTYLGHPDVQPIWEELNRRACVVFIHPTHPVDTNTVNPRTPQPIIDYPHETTRTAYDMLTQGTRLKYPACKVILSHAGGTLPYLISRPTGLVRKMPDAAAKDRIGATYDEMMVGFQSFHYDLALSTSPAVLRLLLENVPHDHILYGSDFPYAPPPAYPAFLEDLENSTMTSELRDKINFGNAINLIPRLSKFSACNHSVQEVQVEHSRTRYVHSMFMD